MRDKITVRGIELRNTVHDSKLVVTLITDEDDPTVRTMLHILDRSGDAWISLTPDQIAELKAVL